MAYHLIDEDDIKNVNKSLFIDNIKTISDLAEERSRAIKQFWYAAKQLMEDE
jgi:hypothetical protein